MDTPSIDLSGVGQALVSAMQNAMPDLVSSAAQAAVPAAQQVAPELASSAGQSLATGGDSLVAQLQSNSLNVLTTTPASLTYANGVVHVLEGVTTAAAIGCLALIVCWAGLQVITHTTLGGLGFGEAFGRVMVGAALLGGTQVAPGWTLEGTNLLQAALLSAPIGGALTSRVDLQDGGAGLVLSIVAVLAALWLYLIMWGRIVLLDVLLVFAPLAAVCWVLPQTHGWFSLWVRQFFGWALVGPAVTLLLVLGLAISASLGGGSAERLAALVLSIAVFVFGALKVPPMVVSGWGQAISSQTVVAAGGAIASGAGAAAAPLVRAIRR